MKSTAVTEHFVAVIARIESGESVRSICVDLKIDRNRFTAAVQADRAASARFKAAQAAGALARKSNPPSSATRHFDKFLSLIRSGATMDEACRQNPEFPKPGVFRWYASKDPARRAALDAALQYRESGSLARGRPFQKFSEADYEHALDTIRLRPRFARLSGGRAHLGDGLPKLSTIYARARLDPVFRERLGAALSVRPKFISAVAPKRVYREGEHAGRLSICEIYSMVARLVPRSYFDCDDIISQIVVGMLERKVGPDDLTSFRAAVKPIRLQLNAMLSVYSLDSILPAKVDGENSETFLDQFSTSEVLW